MKEETVIALGGLVAVILIALIFTLAQAEQPLDRAEREALRAAQQGKAQPTAPVDPYRDRIRLMLMEASYRDELYLDTRSSHAWCASELSKKITELEAMKQILLERTK